MAMYRQDGAHAADGAGADERSIGDLTRQLSTDVSVLVRQELELARAEMLRKGRRAGLGAGMLGGAGLLGLASFAALTACFIIALALVLPAWASALIVAAVYGALAGGLALRGRSEVRAAGKPAPEQAIESVKEDVELARSRARAGRA